MRIETAVAKNVNFDQKIVFHSKTLIIYRLSSFAFLKISEFRVVQHFSATFSTVYRRDWGPSFVSHESSQGAPILI